VLLDVKNLQASYGSLQVLWDVSFNVAEGEFVALLGPNGAGKSTTLKCIAGLIKPTGGEVLFKGRSIRGAPSNVISQMGLCLVPESLDLFGQMTVYENLQLGAYLQREKRAVHDTLDLVYNLFPVLATRRRQLAGTLSGGERKMLALGRGLMGKPQLLLIDEPSLGLAPNTMQSVLDAACELHQRGITILLVEQNVDATLEITQRAYVLEHGRVVLEGASADLTRHAHVKEAYLGVVEG